MPHAVDLYLITDYAIREYKRLLKAGDTDPNLTSLEEDVQEHFNLEDDEFEDRDISFEIYEALREDGCLVDE